MKIAVIYASQTNKTTKTAQYLHYYLQSSNKDTATILNVSDITSIEYLSQFYAIIYMTSTYFIGNHPTSAKLFIEQLRNAKLNNKQTKYIVIGFGNSTHANTYCHAALDVDYLFSYNMGYEQIYEAIKLDASAIDYSRQIVYMQKQVLGHFSFDYAEPDEYIPYYVEINTDAKSVDIAPLNYHLATLVDAKLLSQAESFAGTQRFYTIQLPYQLEYNTGDTAVILPYCYKYYVYRMFDLYLIYVDDENTKLLNINDYIKISVKNEKYHQYLFYINTWYKASHLVAQYCDLYGPVTLEMIDKMLLFKKDKQVLQTYSKDLKLFYSSFVQYENNFLDLLDMLKIKLSVSQLLNIVKPPEPRLYSIASSSSQMYRHTLQLLITDKKFNSRNIYNSLEVTTVDGLTTGFLKKLALNSKIAMYIEHSALKYPSSHQHQLMLIAFDSGYAPFRALLQERYYYLKQGVSMGYCHFFFYARSFCDFHSILIELIQWANENVCKLYLCFKNYQESFYQYSSEYVTIFPEIIMKMLYSNIRVISTQFSTTDSVMYYCGKTGQIVADMQQMIQTKCAEIQGIPLEQLYSIWKQQSDEGKLVFEGA